MGYNNRPWRQRRREPRKEAVTVEGSGVERGNDEMRPPLERDWCSRAGDRRWRLVDGDDKRMLRW